VKFDRTKLYEGLRGLLFNTLSQSQVDGINAILQTWENHPNDFADRRHLSYALATAYHETDQKMAPIAEYGLGKGKAYGQPAAPYNKVYYGRGLVQLTWWYNYVRAQIELGDMGIKLDLVRNPDLALSPIGATEILLYGMTQGWFTGMKLTNYFNHGTGDPVGARRIINGTEKAAMIAGYYTKFDKVLQGAVI
jgi:predicted chitinase